MKNDFDFIRDKFSSDGVTAPGDINESLVLEKVKDTEPLKVKKSKKKIIGIASAAVAGVAVITAASIVVTGVLSHLPVSVGTPVSVSGTARLTRMNSRDEGRKALRHAISNQEKRNRAFGLESESYLAEDSAERSLNGDIGVKKYAADSNASANTSGGAAGGSSAHNSTYVQHVGVDEADTVKTDGEYIYSLANSGEIQIFPAVKGVSAPIASIQSGGTYDSWLQEFYIRGGNLIMIRQRYTYGDDEEYYLPEEQTLTEIYDISDKNNIQLKSRFGQSGSYCSSRMIDGMLYLVSTQHSYKDTDLPTVCNGDPAEKGSFDEIPADCVYSVENPSDSSFLNISSIDTDKGADVCLTKSVLGSADTIYCNREYLYVTAAEYEPQAFEGNRAFSWAYFPTASKTQIIKVDLNRDLDIVAAAKVNGVVDNQYSFDEYNGNLRVATTSRDEDNRDINNLYVLDGELNQIGEVTGFAPNESIKAVRYMGDTAYVITYEQTDPLFVIDVSDPTAPVIKGEVKISGFSSLLVPVDENTVLGIGYHTEDEGLSMEIQEGLKIVTFDVSDKASPKVLDTKIFKNYDSEVQYNPRALLVNPERNDYTIPYSYTDWSSSWWEDVYSNTQSCQEPEHRSGYINFRVDGGKLEIVEEYASDVFAQTEVNRCVYTDNVIYMLGGSSLIDSREYK